MQRHHYHISYYNQTSPLKRTKRIIIVLTGVVMIGILAVLVDILLHRNGPKPVSQEINSSVQAASINIFRTEYYQFQASSGWREIANESKPKHFVYRSYKGPLVEQELIIDVDKVVQDVLALVQVSRVYPVDLVQNKALLPGKEISDHCKKALPATAVPRPTPVTYAGVKFDCSLDSTGYNVVVGLIGGTNNIKMTRPDNTTAVYNINYKNLTATPNARDLRYIIESFQPR